MPFIHAATALCRSCHVARPAHLHVVIGQNGGRHYTWVCTVCRTHGCFSNQGAGSRPFFIPHEKVLLKLTPEQIEDLPVIMPDASNRCVKCGSREAELHHWAPKEIFGEQEAELWPKDYLCVACHLEWHARMAGLPVAATKTLPSPERLPK